MATQRQTLRAFLEADATLVATLTGGIWDADELDLNLLTPNTPGIMDNLHRVKPCLLIRWRTAAPKENPFRTERRFAEFYFYSGTGAAAIETAKARVKALLNRTRLKLTDNTKLNCFHWVSDRGELPDITFGNATSDVSRYYVDYSRV
jgi:hypothetical protein